MDFYPFCRVFVVNGSVVSDMRHFNKVLFALCIYRPRVLICQSCQYLHIPNSAGNVIQILLLFLSSPAFVRAVAECWRIKKPQFLVKERQPFQYLFCPVFPFFSKFSLVNNVLCSASAAIVDVNVYAACWACLNRHKYQGKRNCGVYEEVGKATGILRPAFGFECMVIRRHCCCFLECLK